LASLNAAEAPLESQMGWVHGSQISRVYVDLEGKQHESAILKAYGIQKEEKPKEITSLKKIMDFNIRFILVIS
jgi:hypothetical protein